MTTMTSLSTKQLDSIANANELTGYPKSKYFVVGYCLGIDNRLDLAIVSFKRGAEHGCIPCMYFYLREQDERGNVHLVIPWALECCYSLHN